jgi:PAS domain S-box-containing protein
MGEQRSEPMTLDDWERFFALSPDMLCVARFDGAFERLNPAWEKTLGWTTGELLSRPWLDFVHPDDRAAAVDARGRLAEGAPIISFTSRCSCKDGSHKWLAFTAAPARDADTMYAAARDITESKRASEEVRGGRDELKLRAAERSSERRQESSDRQQADDRFRLLVESVRDYAIFIVDPDGRVVTWNSGAERITGFSEEESVGGHMRRFYPPKDAERGKPEEELRVALARGRMESEEWRARKDGTLFWANVVVTPLYDDAGTHLGFADVTRDLTERRALEEHIRQSEKMEAVGRLAGGIAHDFNNVLSVILSYSEMIGGDLKPEEPLRADIEEIRTAALRAADLTRQLLAFSRQQVLETTVLELNRSVAGMEKMLRRLLGAHIELTMLLASGLWNIEADPGQIEQIVMNLAVNARDAMPDGGQLTIETTNVELDDDYAQEHHDVRAGSHVMLAVSDTGIGMDRETKARVFEPFFTTKERGRGTGLGLATVFGIIKQSGGHIWAYSEPGAGTTFKTYFPRVSGAAMVRASERPTPELGHGSETILLVEDDDQVRVIARNILRRTGYIVLEASNGGEALLICEQHGSKIDLLLTDVVLPRMNGRQLAERLASARPELKVLFMSGYTDDAILQHGVLDSGVAYLQKPLTPASLTRKVREVLRRGRGR